MRRGRMGRPGLVGTVARTAVISGTATAVSNNVSRRQAGKAQQAQAVAQLEQQQEWEAQQQWAAQQAAAAAAAQPPPPAPVAAPPATAGSGDATIDKLKELAELKAQGILTDDEFAAQKARILAG
ncbi:MAG: SHOCT domain-containing protein [Acidimicrobiales bacterium]